MEGALRIKILDLPVGGLGGPKRAALIRQRVRELAAALEVAYPGQTALDYFNLREHPAEKECAAGQMLVTGRVPGPVVVIDGQARLAGNIRVAMIVKAVGRVLCRRLEGAGEGRCGH